MFPFLAAVGCGGVGDCRCCSNCSWCNTDMARLRTIGGEGSVCYVDVSVCAIVNVVE